MNSVFNEIQAGLEDAIQHAKGQSSVITHEPPHVDVKSLRKETGMSQQQFCAAFGVSLGTLRHWEQGLRRPRGAALTLLKVVEKNPKAVIEAISEGV